MKKHFYPLYFYFYKVLFFFKTWSEGASAKYLFSVVGFEIFMFGLQKTFRIMGMIEMAGFFYLIALMFLGMLGVLFFMEAKWAWYQFKTEAYQDGWKIDQNKIQTQWIHKTVIKNQASSTKREML